MELAFFLLAQKADPLVVLAREHLRSHGIGLRLAVLDGDVEDPAEKGQLAVHGRRLNVLAASGDMAVNVAGQTLRQCATLEGSLPRLGISLVVIEPAETILVAGEVVVDHIGEEPVAPPDALREEASLLNLVLNRPGFLGGS